jgi:hypothetical protein
MSQSNVEEVSAYIRRQKEHHHKFSFRDEFIQFLRLMVLNKMSGICELSAASRAPCESVDWLILGFAALHPRLYAIGRFAGYLPSPLISSLTDLPCYLRDLRM